MIHAVPEKREPYAMLERALKEGWHPIDSVPLKGEGPFLVLTVSGLVRLARNPKAFRNPRRADAHGPKRMTVVAVKTGNYLGAMAWKWPEPA